AAMAILKFRQFLGFELYLTRHACLIVPARTDSREHRSRCHDVFRNHCDPRVRAALRTARVVRLRPSETSAFRFEALCKRDNQRGGVPFRSISSTPLTIHWRLPAPPTPGASTTRTRSSDNMST